MSIRYFRQVEKMDMFDTFYEGKFIAAGIAL